MPNIDFYKLETAFTSLREFDPLAKPEHFLEVSLWHNDEGFDAYFSSHHQQTIRLTWGEFKALKKLVKELDK